MSEGSKDQRREKSLYPDVRTSPLLRAARRTTQATCCVQEPAGEGKLGLLGGLGGRGSSRKKKLEGIVIDPKEVTLLEVKDTEV